MKTSQIIEELVRIKIELEQGQSSYAQTKINSLIEKLCSSKEGKSKSVSKSHHSNCALEMDPDYYGPCTCHKYDKSDWNDL